MTEIPGTQLSLRPILSYLINGAVLIASGGNPDDDEDNADIYSELNSVCTLMLRYGATKRQIISYASFI